ncbi:MFS transporter [Herpetosiphon llansteffanensis]|uniref:MFS transporter n=1 Tax=Herpetosiphon llansteffanensis TaxID=2094568 RepID=UPI000D7BF8BF|nr:MFS transporter [Herpetosiphon llansteffanensis]
MQQQARLSYLVLSFSTRLMLSCIFTASMLYRIQVLGLDPLQLVLVGTVLEAAAFGLEIPTGVVADIYSRRLSVVLGVAFLGLGALSEVWLGSFVGSLLAQVVWSLGYSLMSGATEAWITDELGVEAVEALFLKAAQLNSIASLVGIGVGIGLARFGLAWPMISGGAALVGLAFWMRWLMPETGFAPAAAAERQSWGRFGATLSHGWQAVRIQPLLISLMLISAIAGAASEGYDRLWEAHLLTNIGLPTWLNWQPVTWFGAIAALGTLASLLAVSVIKRLASNTSERSMLLLRWQYGLLAAGLLGLAFAQQFAVALFWIMLIRMLRQSIQPLYSAWLNRLIESRSRATIISMDSQADAFGQILGGPIIGLIASRMGLPAAFVAASCCLWPMLVLLRRRQLTK